MLGPGMPSRKRHSARAAREPRERASNRRKLAHVYGNLPARRITMIMRSLSFALVVIALLQATPAAAQQQAVLGEDTVKVSDHVWAIMGFPNIGIVVGTQATLVVDTGLGPRNGATVARVAARLSTGQKLYLTTTHFHPE